MISITFLICTTVLILKNKIVNPVIGSVLIVTGIVDWKLLELIMTK